MYVGDFNVHPIKIQDKNNTKGRGAKVSCCKIPYHGGYCLKKQKNKKTRRRQVLLRLWRKGSHGHSGNVICVTPGENTGVSQKIKIRATV